MPDENRKNNYEVAVVALEDQTSKARNRTCDMRQGMSLLEGVNASNHEAIEILKTQLGTINDVDLESNVRDDTLDCLQKKIEDVYNSYNQEEEQVIEWKPLELIGLKNNENWDDYLVKVNEYISANDIRFSEKSLENLLTQEEKNEIIRRLNEDYFYDKAHCDKYDYLIAAFSGVVGGLIDSIFVGMPSHSKLGGWVDGETDKFVERIAQSLWKSDKRVDGKPKKIPDTLHKAISYLEQRYKVNYDARYASDLRDGIGKVDGMSPSNHHIKSLAHAPNLIGLIFSIIDQFTGKASFISNGKVVRLEPVKGGFELRGATFRAKLCCGISNWLGHLISDLVGSSSTRNASRGKTGRGRGLGIPFYELFQFCDFGEFEVNNEQLNLAEFSLKVFEKGYDFRFGATMSIPVMVNEVIVRLLWAIKQRYYHKKAWNGCLPFGNHPELRRMLLVGHGTFCIVDGVDAFLRSGGERVEFALRLNIIGWSRFAMAGLIEIRCLYKEQAFNYEALNKDIEEEWKKISEW